METWHAPDEDRKAKQAKRNEPSSSGPVPQKSATEGLSNRGMQSVVPGLQLQLKGTGGAVLDETIATAIHSKRGSGEQLDSGAAEKIGKTMGHDFSDVQVHKDSESDQLNKQVHAEAFTTGKDIFFREGKYDPVSDQGQKLLAHELTHVVQQRDAPATSELRVSDPNEASEKQAEKTAEKVTAPAGSSTSAAGGGGERRPRRGGRARDEPRPAGGEGHGRGAGRRRGPGSPMTEKEDDGGTQVARAESEEKEDEGVATQVARAESEEKEDEGVATQVARAESEEKEDEGVATQVARAESEEKEDEGVATQVARAESEEKEDEGVATQVARAESEEKEDEGVATQVARAESEEKEDGAPTQVARAESRRRRTRASHAVEWEKEAGDAHGGPRRGGGRGEGGRGGSFVARGRSGACRLG